MAFKELTKSEGPVYTKWAAGQPRAKIKRAAWNLFGTISLHKEFRASQAKKKATAAPVKKTAGAKPVKKVSLAKSHTPRPIPNDKKATMGSRSVLGG